MIQLLQFLFNIDIKRITVAHEGSVFFGLKSKLKEVYLKQTLKDFEKRRVAIDVRVAVFYRTSWIILLVWAQQDFYWTLSAGQMDRQTLERGETNI